jgi:hypothetical protein
MDVNSGSPYTLPLNQAISYGDVAVINAVLDAGAGINGPRSYIDMRRPRLNAPLECAASVNRKAVGLLISRGPIVPPVETWTRAVKSVYDAFR